MNGSSGLAPTTRVAIIGAGVMGEALVRALLKAGLVEAGRMVAADKSPQRLEHMERTYQVPCVADNARAAQLSDVVVIAVKPQHLAEALEEMAPAVQPDRHLVLSIVAGVSTASLERFLPPGTPVVRAMPNTAASVGQAATGLCAGRFATEGHRRTATALLEAVGRVVWVPEHLMDAVTGLSGSGPAYGFLVIEALAEGGIAAGLPREEATLLAAASLLGAATLALESGRHPAELRQQVTSPAGTTAAGLLSLESRAVRAAFIEAVLAASRRARELGESVRDELERRQVRPTVRPEALERPEGR